MAMIWYINVCYVTQICNLLKTLEIHSGLKSLSDKVQVHFSLMQTRAFKAHGQLIYSNGLSYFMSKVSERGSGLRVGRSIPPRLPLRRWVFSLIVLSASSAIEDKSVIRKHRTTTKTTQLSSLDNKHLLLTA